MTHKYPHHNGRLTGSEARWHRKHRGGRTREGITVVQLFQLFPDNVAAERWSEAQRWPDGRFYPDCGSTDTVAVKSRKPMPYRYRVCRGHFSVARTRCMIGKQLRYLSTVTRRTAMPNDVVTIPEDGPKFKRRCIGTAAKAEQECLPRPGVHGKSRCTCPPLGPWIAGYSKHFVEDALERHTSGASMVLDPFSGVGTTLVEADLAGHDVCGFEINPYAAFVAQTKLKAHRIDADCLRRSVQHFRKFMADGVRNGLKPHTSSPAGFRTHAPFNSPDVERKVLLIWDFISEQKRPVADIFAWHSLQLWSTTRTILTNQVWVESSCWPSRSRRLRCVRGGGRQALADCG